MSVSINPIALTKALKRLSGVATRRSTIPILSHVLAEMGDDVLRLTATDLEVEITIEVPAFGKLEQPVAFDPRRVIGMLGKSRSEHVDLIAGNTVDAAFSIKDEELESRTFTLPACDFPHIDYCQQGMFSVPAAEFLRLIDRTRFAISTEETRYYLNGIYFHIDAAGDLCAVATDGHRLAKAVSTISGANLPKSGIILHRDAVSALYAALKSCEKTSTVTFGWQFDGPLRSRFQIGRETITSKLIDGEFPDYTRVIPAKNDKLLTMGRAAFFETAARVASIGSERSRAIKLILAPDAITFEAASPEQGIATAHINSGSVDYKSTPLEIGFQARYLADIGAQIVGDLRVEFKDGGAPAIFRDVAEPKTTYLLMPMRV